MWISWKKAVAALVVTVLFLACACGAADSVNVIVEDFWGARVVRAIAKEAASQRDIGAKLERDSLNLRRFVEGTCQIVALSAYPAEDRGAWIYGFPSEDISRTAFLVGQAKVCVVVNNENALQEIAYPQLRLILGKDGQGTTWTSVGGGGGKIAVYGESKKSASRAVLRSTAMRKVIGGTDYNFLPFGGNWQECDDADGVVNKVKSDPNGIGFVLCKGVMPTGVRVLSVRKAAADAAVKVGDGLYIQPDYPLAESLVLYLHPAQPFAAKRFCEFAIGPEGSAVAEKFGLITPRMHVESQGRARLADRKAGKGAHVSAVCADRGGAAVADLATEFVRAKAVVQAQCSTVDSDVAGVGAFVRGGAETSSSPAVSVSAPTEATPGGATRGAASSAPVSVSKPAGTTRWMPVGLSATSVPSVPPLTSFVRAGGKELLLLFDKPGARAMELYGAKWNALGVDKDGQPDGTGPAEHVIAGRAVAVIVNPANKLESLSVPRVQAIFSGEVDDWSVIGGTGFQPAAAEAQPGKAVPPQGAVPIGVFGLRANDPATALFEKECLIRARWKRVTTKNDTAEAVAAVSMDPQAIAFVDLTGIPGLGAAAMAGQFAAAGQSVKVLAIQIGVGERAKIVRPTPENIKNAMYPFSQRLRLYVHPQASETAKDFAKFIATCGASEAGPYADTVKAVMETYRKHGLIPLADAAVVRMTKDAMAEAAARTEADAARSTGSLRSEPSGSKTGQAKP